MNDYELVMKAKLDQRYAIQLFNQYEPLIHHMFKNFKRINRHTSYEFNDYLSESYIVLLSALKRVSINRITDPQKWKFMHFYRQSLEWKNYAFNHHVEQKNNKTIPASHWQYNNKEESTFYAIFDLVNHTDDDSVYNEVINSICIDKFKTKLNQQELKVLSLYMGKNDRMKTPTLEEIGEKMNLTKQRISVIVQNMKTKWQELEKVV